MKQLAGESRRTSGADLERRCDHCGEVGTLVGGACYDCARLCGLCRREPADPTRDWCPECLEAA